MTEWTEGPRSYRRFYCLTSLATFRTDGEIVCIPVKIALQFIIFSLVKLPLFEHFSPERIEIPECSSFLVLFSVSVFLSSRYISSSSSLLFVSCTSLCNWLLKASSSAFDSPSYSCSWMVAILCMLLSSSSHFLSVVSAFIFVYLYVVVEEQQVSLNPPW